MNILHNLAIVGFYVFDKYYPLLHLRLPGGLVVKNPAANAGDIGDVGPVPGAGRSLGKAKGNPLLYSCLGNHMDCSPPGYSQWNRKESDITDQLNLSRFSLSF